MKKPITLIFLCATFILFSSMGISDRRNGIVLSVDNHNLDQEEGQKPLFEKGMITIKLKKELQAIPAQKGTVTFNIQSLDILSKKLQLSGISKRFKHDPNKLRRDLPDLSRIYRVTFSESTPVQRVVNAFSSDSKIEYAEAIPINYICESPNDPYYYQQHFLPQIQAEEAWEIHKGEDGDEEVVIAIVDTGVDWDHEDLQANAWQNLGEDADGDGVVMEYDGSAWIFDPDDENGIDDDGNGFVDDFTGWGYYYETNDPSSVSGDYAWDHGTHCAGLSAAVTDNEIGVAAISWNVEFMSLHVASGDGEESLPFAYDGIIYAAENGAEIISNSWGGYLFSQAYFEVIQYANGLGSIIVASAGNDNKYDMHYPSNYPGVISVAAIDKTDYKANYSNYGPNISVGAPGGEGSANGLYSTVPNDGYNWMAGTSMAGPTCAGLIGLVRSYHPEWSNQEVITQVLGTADNIDSLNPTFINQLGTGRINAFRALTETNVELPEELKLEILTFEVKDLDGDDNPAQGDTIFFNITLQNYSLGGTDQDAGFHLTCDNLYMEVISSTFSDTIPADNYFTLHNAFQVVIDNECPTQDVEFRLTSSSDLPILYGDTIQFKTLVAPQGICIYRGEGTGSAYSGEYIKNFLEGYGHEAYYTSTEPQSLKGFDVVFVSLGNLGQTFEFGTIATDEFCEKCALYLQDGGNMYLEGGSFMGLMQYFDYSWYEELKGLFSIAGNEISETANSIDTLTGLEGSIADNLFFTGTNQNPYWYIDILTPNDDGIAMFEENDYGIVAVQGEGEYGQKTIINGYAISKLQAGEPGMTLSLMEEVCQYLGIEVGVGVEDVVPGSRFQVSGWPNPTSGEYNITITLDQSKHVSIQVYDLMSNLVINKENQQMNRGENAIEINLMEFEAGIYFLCVQIGEETFTKKIIKK